MHSLFYIKLNLLIPVGHSFLHSYVSTHTHELKEGKRTKQEVLDVSIPDRGLWNPENKMQLLNSTEQDILSSIYLFGFGYFHIL